MGSSTDPSRIFPGKKQAGHMGVEQVTVQNLDVVKVDPELNMIVVRGAIPGPKGGIVYIKNTVKKLVVKNGATPASAPTRRRPPVVTRRRLLQESKEGRERICLLLSCLIWPAIRSAKWRSPKPFSVLSPTSPSLHDSVKNHLANCRQGTQSALTKGEVSYTTAKPWRQKGTGRARAGYKGSPVWTHGGVAFAPKPRDYSYVLNKKVKQTGPQERAERQGRRRRASSSWTV